ncbi:MAG: apolipoprotein N-acyltransferase, partial [Bacteroidota bacterium]|nr:apolipoprotein N-acyltransferase [Bacteroidota bacterium]
FIMMKLNKKYIFLLLALSSILFSLPWFSHFSGIILFIAFIPLLIIERLYYENRDHNKSVPVLLYSTVVFIIWNISDIYWIKNSTFFGAVAAVVIGSFLMAMAFWFFHISHRKLGHGAGYFSLIAYWTTFEFIYLKSENLSFPWLSLGNGFAGDIKLIQWYEFTGSTGATPWVLIINILLFIVIWEYIQKGSIRNRIKELVLVILVIIIPLTYSIIRFQTYQEGTDTKEFVILQPNIDPYEEKFVEMPMDEQMQILLQLADSMTDAETDYIVGPETALNDNIWENSLGWNKSILSLKQFISSHPRLKIVIGLTSMYEYGKDETPAPMARKFQGTDGYYSVHNASIQVDSSDNYQIYHKSKLVVGVEKVPFPWVLDHMEKFIIKLGGTTRGYTPQPERSTLNDINSNTKIGTPICYESVYGEFVTGFVKKGANILAIVTNDGWWGDTPGYKQLLSFASLRAIETRRSIARSANTGISCFINQKGEILQATDYWVPAVIKGELSTNEEITFYVKHGDFLSRIFSFFGIITILYTIVASLIANKKNKV